MYVAENIASHYTSTFILYVCHSAIERNILQSVEDEALKQKIHFTDKMERSKVSISIVLVITLLQFECILSSCSITMMQMHSMDLKLYRFALCSGAPLLKLMRNIANV